MSVSSSRKKSLFHTYAFKKLRRCNVRMDSFRSSKITSLGYTASAFSFFHRKQSHCTSLWMHSFLLTKKPNRHTFLFHMIIGITKADILTASSRIPSFLAADTPFFSERITLIPPDLFFVIPDITDKNHL